MITYDEAVKAQALIEDKLLLDPNVVSIGVVEETDNLGQKTGNYVVQVGVTSTEIYTSNLHHGQSVIPEECVIYSDDNSSIEQHVRIHVVKEGKIEALAEPSPDTKKNDLPSAIDDISGSSPQLHYYTSRSRPCPGGFSIGHYRVTAGTIGLLLEYCEGPNKGKAYILSNNHVLADNNVAHVGDHITQPGNADKGVVNKDTIARLYRWVPINFQGINLVDAALAEVEEGLNWSKYVVPFVSKIGYPDGFTKATLSMDVEKSGRTTGYTQGTIISINETIKVNYPSGPVVFKNQIRTTSMSKSGDSGSCLFERGSRKPVGLLFAGGETGSFHNHFGTVLSFLSKPHTNQYAGGVKHHFREDYPLKILKVVKREYSTFSPAHYESKLQVGKSSTLSSPSRYKMFTPQFSTASRMPNTFRANKHIPTAMKGGALLASIGLFAAAIIARPIAALRHGRSNTVIPGPR